jgi:DNA topoisomerase-3
MGCNRCTHPTCPESLVATGVRPCPEAAACGGTLVFQAATRPNFKLMCNSCNFMIKFASNAHGIALLRDKGDELAACGGCGSTLFSVDFNKNNTPLPGGQTKYEGCLFCDPILAETIVGTLFGRVRAERDRGGRGGRGGRGAVGADARGRGGGGGGRGRGRRRDEAGGEVADRDAGAVRALREPESMTRSARERVAARYNG